MLHIRSYTGYSFVWRLRPHTDLSALPAFKELVQGMRKGKVVLLPLYYSIIMISCFGSSCTDTVPWYPIFWILKDEGIESYICICRGCVRKTSNFLHWMLLIPKDFVRWMLLSPNCINTLSDLLFLLLYVTLLNRCETDGIVIGGKE